MEITWDDLKVDISTIDSSTLTQNWEWLIGTDKRAILVTSVGDLFLADQEEACYWLNVGEGTIEKVADSIDEFNEVLQDDNVFEEWFLIGLVERIKSKGMELRPNHLYSYKKLPILGGEYEPENFELTEIQAHFELTGQIHQKIKG